jgi:nicotinate-nucleotide--dimethylbenzimidazole phosphoribosyltransferase
MRAEAWADLAIDRWTSRIVPTRDVDLSSRLQTLIDAKTKPIGALGRLEGLALQLGLIQGSTAPCLRQPQVVVFAADHGLAAQRVSAYPQEVTAQMVENMLAGGAAISVFTRQAGLPLTLVDAGIVADLPPRPGLLKRGIAAGTRDASAQPAMTRGQCEQAVRTGAEVVAGLPGNAVLLGEMGIANSASAALLLCRLGGVPLADCVGHGTGLDEQGWRRKGQVLARVLDRHAALDDPLDVLAALGGFEIAMMAGACLQAAAERRVVVVDGFIAGAAVLAAACLAPAVTDYCVFSHRSAERGHIRLLDRLRVQPLLDLGLRLGEGTGAVLAWPLLQAAVAMLTQMASFESAGVSARQG